MEFRLLPGDTKEPIVHLAVSADGTTCFAGSSAGSFFKYSLDGGSPRKLESPRHYASVTGISFIGSTGDAIAAALSAPATGDVVRLYAAGLVELLYADAPHPFWGVTMCPVADFGLLGSGEELLKWFVHEKSYLPVDIPLGVQVRASAFKGRSQNGVVVGHKDGTGFAGRYEPKPDSGRVVALATPALPALECVASNAAGTLFLAGGLPGGLLEIGDSYETRVVPGPENAVVHGIAFHPKAGWAMLATGPVKGSSKSAALYRYEPGTGVLTVLHEGGPGVGAFSCVVILPQGDRALVGTAAGQLLQVTL